jgi:hypothetical protein
MGKFCLHVIQRCLLTLFRHPQPFPLEGGGQTHGVHHTTQVRFDPDVTGARSLIAAVQAAGFECELLVEETRCVSPSTRVETYRALYSPRLLVATQHSRGTHTRLRVRLSAKDPL